MKVRYSKEFEKSVRKLSGKMLQSVKSAILEVMQAESVENITDCKKLTGFQNVYSIRIGSLRAFFTLHIEIIDNVVFFRFLVSRGEAYDKKNEKRLKEIDL